MSDGPPTPTSRTESTQPLLEIVQQLALELHPQRPFQSGITLDSSLERDLGFDSLGRMELLERLERAFGIRLPEQRVALAESPRDLWQALRQAHPATAASGVADLFPALPEAGVGIPVSATTLLDVLDWHAQQHPQRLHIALYDDTDHLQELTYTALHTAAVAVAAALQGRGLQPGQTVALMLPTSQEFFLGFYGVLLAGAIPVPIYPPARPSQLEEHLQRQRRILENAAAVMLLTVPEARALARLLSAQVPTLRQVLTVPELREAGGTYDRPVIQAHDTALLQYTSGSTGNPKGVILSHANLLANLQAMGQAVQIQAHDVFVSWLPLYHDMGLIGAWLGSLLYACPLVLMSPLAFLARPARWLQAIHRHRGTLSAGPNFAYELCLRRITDRELDGVDLSSWRVAFNGAEPVSAATIQRFSARFAAYGFRPEAMAPVYGLAEAALGVAFPPLGQLPSIDRIQRDPFMRSGQALPAQADDPTALHFVTCGQALPGYQIRLLDAAGHELGERQEGRLEFQGPSTTSGYFRNPDATRQLFHGAWLDSGDMAYTVGSLVYLTGRAKDMIIRAGRNIYPHEVEEAVGNIPGLRRGCVAVFGSPDPATGTERLVVLAETRQTEPAALAQLRQQVETVATDLLGTPPDDVVLAPPGNVLKTSSGKIRRAASRERYEQGDIGTRPRALWWQMLRLLWASLVPQVRRLGQALAASLYAAYLWALCAALVPVAWLLVALIPQRRWCQAILRGSMRLLLRLARIPVTVTGLDNVPAQGPYVLVANHASYLDGPVLYAVLPGGVCYVVKRELAAHWVLRLLLQRIGAVFVERFDVQQGVQDTARLVQAVRQGQSLVLFPEGTFGRVPGLQTFRLGAFVVAAQAGVPVIPLSLCGTRAVLRAEQWFPRYGRLHVHIGPPLSPGGTDWAAAVALREAARRWIAQTCGEPDALRHAPPADEPIVL
ncbi:MAG: AMP-binding protein [Candidatus Tectimicrobiota bacterium]